MTYANILIEPDKHRRDRDSKTIGNYRNVTNKIDDDIDKFIVENDITHLISLGDLYDKGYRSIAQFYSHVNRDRHRSELVNGNYYMVVGNHFWLERDSNPEMYLIQPNKNYKPKEEIFQTKPVIQVIDKLVIGDVQLSFFHNHKTDKMYVRGREEGIKTHIGLYHDSCVVPNSVRRKLGLETTVTSEYLKTIYGNVDIAILGDIHTPSGTENLIIDGRQVPIIIPGSLGITQRSHIHPTVKLPLITIRDGSAKLSYVEFRTYADELKFYETSKVKVMSNIGGKINNKNGIEVQEINPVQSLVSGSYFSLKDYLADKGYDDNHIEAIELARSGQLDLPSTIKLLSKKKED